MLKSVDILIGLSVIMLVASMAVTMITQALINIAGSRGKSLLAGLSDMIEQLAPGFSKKYATEIAKMVLTHQAINGGSMFGIVRYGDVIHREELTKILLEFAAKADQPHNAANKLQQQALETLQYALATNGIAQPEQTLDNVRMFALQLEKSHPQIASNVRQDMALMKYASSQFLAKINARFDAVIDRVSDRFTTNARILTFFSAVLVAVAIQLDTISLVNRLAIDNSVRSAIIQAAIEIEKKETNNSSQNATPAAATNIPDSVNDLQQLLIKEGVLSVPKVDEWADNWEHVNPIGVALSVLLLSLGAPFWYGAISKLIQLRSIVAQKDDAQRLIRQTVQEFNETARKVVTTTTQSTTPGSQSSTNDTANTVLTSAKAAITAARAAETKVENVMASIEEINAKLEQITKKK